MIRFNPERRVMMFIFDTLTYVLLAYAVFATVTVVKLA
jgi:hypothetical protein